MNSNLLNRLGTATLLAVAASVGGWGNSFAAPAIYNLGVLPPLGPGFPYESSFGDGVSADGSTVTGFVRGAEQGERAFRWTKSGGMEDLGTWGGGFSLSLGEALNADGTVVVGLGGAVGFSAIRAFRWTASAGMVGLGTLGGAISMARAVSADGSVVTGLSSDDQGRERAFRWTEGGGMEDLGTLPGFESAGAHDITADGSIVAGWSGSRAVVWVDGAALDLGALPGFPVSVAFAISADGLVVAGESLNPIGGSRRAFRWSNSDGMVELGITPSSTALAVNGDGSMIVGTSSGYAFLWTADLGLVNLNDYLPTLGLDLTGWFLQVARGISADGTVITGDGFFNGERRAFVVDLSPCHGDANGDNVVDFADFSAVLAAYGTCLGDPGYNHGADLNGDGCVDFADFSTALAEYGNEC